MTNYFGNQTLDNYQSQNHSSVSLNQRYCWEQKTDKLNWVLAESIEPDKLVREGDLKSVLFYWDKFRTANVTKYDCRNFGSKGCLNMFLIMQLGSEYYYNEKNRLEANENRIKQEIYDQMREEFNSEIKERDNLILKYKEMEKNNNYLEQISVLKSQINELKKKINDQKRVQKTIFQQKTELEELLSQKSKEIEKYKLRLQREVSNQNDIQISSNEFNILDTNIIENLENLGQIGQGNSGNVIKVCNKSDLQALKIMKNTNFKEFQRFFGEYEILNNFDHPNIMKAHGIFLSDENNPPSILLEFCPTNISNVIKNKKISNVDLIFYIYQIVEGMKYVHFKNIIHRDLKPTNIMIGFDGLIKIGDFGISKLMTTEEQSMTCGIGTHQFMAPEIIDNNNYDNKVDVYSFGVLLFFFLSGGVLPVIKMSDKMNGQKPEIPRYFTHFAHRLIRACLNFKSKDRPSFTQIIDELERNNYCLIHLKDDEEEEIKNKIKEHKEKIPHY